MGRTWTEFGAGTARTPHLRRSAVRGPSQRHGHRVSGANSRWTGHKRPVHMRPTRSRVAAAPSREFAERQMPRTSAEAIAPLHVPVPLARARAGVKTHAPTSERRAQRCRAEPMQQVVSVDARRRACDLRCGSERACIPHRTTCAVRLVASRRPPGGCTVALDQVSGRLFSATDGVVKMSVQRGFLVDESVV